MTRKQRIVSAAALMLVLHFVPAQGLLRLGLYLVPYFIVGYDILRSAAIGIRNRQVLDENFLMAIATVGAIVSYWPIGIVSSRFGRKRVIQFGILLMAACFLAGALLPGMHAVMYLLFALVGLGWAAINVNSFPMVVEMASGADTGKYTGLYYTFSMSAQVLTPILSGALLEHVGYFTLFPYAMVMMLLAFATFFFVKHGDNKPEARHGLEVLDVGDD